jgi:OmpA-OmpF porin, OOP family
MSSQRTLLGLVLGVTTAFAVSAQTNPALRWRAGTAPLGLHIGYMDEAAALRISRPQDLTASVTGKTDIAPAIGLYGRVGSTAARAGLIGAPGSEGGVTYGVGLSWDFSRRGSASVGWDTYDFRTLGGDSRDVRATSLGLQWRY